jgi:peptide/nickel transport system substrate-binding protein
MAAMSSLIRRAFTSGEAGIGIGPYHFISYAPGGRITFRSNDACWGERPAWAEVVIRLIPNAAARTALLLGMST